MKHYKLLAPVVLTALFAVSVYAASGSNAEIEKRYEDSLAAARLYARQMIVVDAAASYAEALEIRDSFELRMEVAAFYKDAGELDMAADWGQETLGAYPERAESYAYLMDIYAGAEDYTACFRLADTMEKRRLPEDSIAGIMEGIEYSYFFQGAYEDVSVFGGGYCAVMAKGVWGFVNEEGKRVIKPRFAEVGAFRQDLAPALDGDMKAYFIDPEGNKKRTALGVESVVKLGMTEDGVYTLYDGEAWRLYNGENSPVTDGYDEMSSFSNGVTAAKKDGAWSVLGADGAALSPYAYDGIARDEKGVVYRNERLFALEDGGYYLIGKSGERIAETKFEDARLFCDATYAAVRSGGKWGFIDSGGEYVVKPEYDGARSFSNGLAAVKIDGKWGFIDEENRLVIENIFEDAKDFNGRGGVFVRSGGDWELLRLYKFNH
ncbi:MAG: WG repeat-containing protein [Oscillospiraceae bacterium]|nr:WG repeat-containing protein [Oscillospiraceae bacterium]